jgi:transcriptional regulator with XRE-family HTH domain
MSKRWSELKAKRGLDAAVLPPEEGRDEGLGLGELRAAVGMTQVELAKAMQVDQPRISRYERQTDIMLTTLRDYVAGLGGQLELLARFPDDRVIWLEPPDAGAVTDVTDLMEALEEAVATAKSRPRRRKVNAEERAAG